MNKTQQSFENLRMIWRNGDDSRWNLKSEQPGVVQKEVPNHLLHLPRVSAEMGLVYVLQTQIQVDAPADKFYEVFKKKNMHFHNIASGHIHGVELHDGDWELEGSIKTWTFTVDGRVEKYKEKTEFNDEKRSVTQVGIDGEVMKSHYKYCKATYEATPKGDGSIVTLRVEYEKHDGDAPCPEKYIDAMIGVSKGISDHLTKG